MLPATPAEPKLPPPRIEEFVFQDWRLRVVKSHIMGSQCEAVIPCLPDTPTETLCNFCRYPLSPCLNGKERQQLVGWSLAKMHNETYKFQLGVLITTQQRFERELELPSLPDMVFANNLLELRHRGGGSIAFTALDALRCVNPTESTVQVAHAEVWREARADCEGAQKVVEPYDWTYTTNFRGKLTGGLVAQETTERIDLDRLKVQEEIKFYAEIFLFEDELDDNGCTRCVAKVRVMPSGLFVVLRHYLRVDQVIVRINDTRLYSPAGAGYILRESSTREAPISNLRVPSSIYNNPDVVWQHLPLVEETVDKLVPASVGV